MSEAKRVPLQSVGPVKKDKKTKPTSTTIRLNLTLPPSVDTYAEFNYKTLIFNEKKKAKNKEREEGKVNGFEPLDPYASDDEDKLKEIARSFESRYGTPKKKCRRLEDYSELGTGYDENDSFIDNTDAFDEAVPEDQTTECGGFYVNKGDLILKRVDGRSSSDSSDSESSGSPQKSHKRRLESDSESDSSESSSGSSDSDDSEDSEDEDEDDNDNEAAEVDTDESPCNVKENRTNGHTVDLVKKPKPSDDVKCAEFSSKKSKNKAIAGLFMKKAVREKEHNENRQKLNIEGEAKRRSNVDAAIEAVARGEDSKESGIAESKSHSDLSDSYDSDDSQGSLKVNGRPNELQHPLPDNLPEKLVSLVSALKAKAAEDTNMTKHEFFSTDVNSLLLRFEKNLRHVPSNQRGLVYEHLQCFLPCSKEYLMKKTSDILRDSVEAGVRAPLSLLKQGIDLLMPNAIKRYNSVCQRLENERNVDSLKETSENIKSSPEKAKIPRRRFPWTEELKSLLIQVVKKRRVYFHVMRENKDETWPDHLKEFFKQEVLPMWESGWMKMNSLLDILMKMSPDLLDQDVKKKLVSPNTGGRKSGDDPKPPAPPPSVSVQSQPPALSPAPILSQPVPSNRTSTPTPPPPPLSVVSPISSPVSPPPTAAFEAEPPMKKSKPNVSPPELLVQQSGDGLLDLSSADSGVKKSHSYSSGPSSVQTSVVHTSNHNSSKGVTVGDFMGNKLSSVSSSGSLTVKPAQKGHTMETNDLDRAGFDASSKKRDSQGNCAYSSKSSHINNDVEVNVLNLKSPNSSDIPASTEYSSKKKLAAHLSGSSSVKAIPNSPAKPFSQHSLETPNSQPSSIVLNSGLVNSSQAPLQISNSSTIKVSSVAAINLKLTSQAQTQSSQASSHPLKTSNLPDVLTPINLKPQVSTFSSPSVISHSAESNNSSLTITPVKPFQPGKASTQSSGASSMQNNNSSLPVSPQVSSSVRSERTEVIVTPSNSMPHIKTTSVSANLQSHRPDSAISYTSSNITMRTHKPSRSQTEALNSSKMDKNAYMPSTKSQDLDKVHVPPFLWSSPVVMDSVSPTPLKTPGSEKVMVSRKDRILQESRDRGVIDSSMPTLSGPFRIGVQDTAAKLRPHPLVSSASMDSYKQPVQVSESQRCDSVKSHSPIEPQRTKSMTISSNSESQRVNVVMQAPTSHSKDYKSSLLINSQSRDHLKAVPSLGRATSTSSCVLDTRANVVMATSSIQETNQVNSVKDEMNDILASIPSQLISRTDHYTITNSMPSHLSKRGSNLSDIDDAGAVELKDDAQQTAQELSTRGTLMSRTNCDVNFSDDGWQNLKKTAFIKSPSDVSDHRLSGMSGLSMSGLDGMGLGLPPHLVGYQNEYQRHLYGSTSKSGQSDHRPF